MQKANIDLQVIGVRGGSPILTSNKGEVTIYIDSETGNNNWINIDAFIGQGEAYQRRDKCRIKIKNKDGKLWDGTMEELTEKLFK